MRLPWKRAGLVGLIFAALGFTAARGQSQDNDIYAETSAMASELTHSPTVKQWFAANRPRVTLKHAEAAEQMARQARRAGDEAKAYPYSAFAMYAFLYLGDNARSLENRLDERDLSFEEANTPERYDFVRHSVLESRDAAASVGRPDLVFAFQVLAADCSFFASNAKLGSEADEPLFNAVSDEADALSALSYSPSRDWVERLMSLTGTTSDKVIRMGLLGDQKARMDPMMKRLAANLESAVRGDFEFTILRWGDAHKTILLDDALADLSYKYGNGELGKQRLSWAATRARQSGEESLRLWILAHQYSAEKERGIPPEQLRALRDEIRAGAQDLRANYRSLAGRIWEGHRADKLYGDLLRDQLAESQELTEASFSFVEALKARTLLDILYVPPPLGFDPADVSALEQRPSQFTVKSPKDEAGTIAQQTQARTPRTQDIRTNEDKLISHLSFFYEDMMNAYEEEPSPRMKAIGQLETKYRQTGEGFISLAVPASLAEVQQSLGPREALLEYVIPYHRSHPAFDLYILLITRGSARNVHVALNQALPFNIPLIGTMATTAEGAIEYSQLGKLIVDARTAIQTGDEQGAQKSLRELYKVLIEPLTVRGVRLEDFDRLVIVPHGPLHYVPFAALMDGERKYLISKTALTVAPSASVWLTLTKRGGPVQHFVGFGNPSLPNQTGELKYAAQEMIDIPKLLPAMNPTVFVGPDATEDRFVQEAPSAGILHVSTHGEFPDENAIDSHAILLAKGNSGNGTLRAARVRTLNLSSAGLVALSVCNGGLYRMGPADEPYGLVPAFLEAGAQNVLGTLWKLDDQFGKEFMEEFYRHVMQDGPAEAYRKACLHFLEKDEDLRNWAAFVLVGPGRPFATQRNSSSFGKDLGFPRAKPEESQPTVPKDTSQRTRPDRSQLLRVAFPQLSGNDAQAGAKDHVERGRKLYAQGDLDGSIREYRAAVRLDPGVAAAHYLLGLALGYKDDTEGEISEYRAALRINPNIADAHLWLGEALDRKKDDLDGAISEYRAALSIYPDQRYPNSFAAHSHLGSALARKRDLDGSISEFRAAIRLKPENPGPHVGLGMALEDKADSRSGQAALKLYEEAFEEYNRALALDPKVSKVIQDRYDFLRGVLGKK